MSSSEINSENFEEKIETSYYTFGSVAQGLQLDCGQTLGPITLAYETYGQLNASRSNAVLLCHALSGDAHAAGIQAEDGRRGWWDLLVGPSKAFDTEKYFVICSNVIGGCKGSTGPSSLNPRTGQPYALDFPVITIEDMVRAQKQLLDYLGIETLLSVVGGSMGGMQAMAWCQLYPNAVRSAILVATSHNLSAQGIAWNEIGRRAIMADQNWDNGNYYAPDHPRPEKGLAVARSLAHITYLSENSMQSKFGRRLRNRDNYSYSFGIDFEIESYLEHQGEIFNRRFDANSYLYITRALDYFDMTHGTDDLIAAFAETKASYLVISFDTDWLYPPSRSLEMVAAARAAARPVEYLAAKAPFGHDSFLLESAQQAPVISRFLQKLSS